MTAATRLSEFSTGTGTRVHVDRRGKHHYIHLDPDCENRTKHEVAVYPTEKIARAALPNAKACKTCRT